MEYKEIFYMYRLGFYGEKRRCSDIPLKFRFDSVPNTGRWKKRVRPYYREMRTTQERRWVHPHKEFIRAKRGSALMPDPWGDEYRVFDESIRSWKRTKKAKQWM